MTICGIFCGRSCPSGTSIESTFALYPLISRTFACANFSYRSVISATAQCNAPEAFFGSVTTGIIRCGIPLYTLSSTTFGSIIKSLTSLGSALYKILIMIVLMQTDLPDPVAPAIRRCGIFAISVTFVLPAISLPTAKLIFDLDSLNSFDSIRSRNATVTFSLFGTSIPTAAFPGIGASIRMSAAARLSLISSASPTILLTFTPISGWISYLVTAGPQLILVTVTLTPNVFSVCCSLLAVSRSWLSVLADFFPDPALSRSTGGKTYFFSGCAAAGAISCTTSAISFWISSSEVRALRLVCSATVGTSSDVCLPGFGSADSGSATGFSCI